MRTSILDLVTNRPLVPDTRTLGLTLTSCGLAGALTTAYLGFNWAPLVDPEAWNAPEAYRILYWHVPFAWTSFLAFCLLFVGAVSWYRKRTEWGWRFVVTGSDLGLLFGLALHRACRERAWRPGALGESRLIALTVHSAGAGVVIGMLYGQMPELGLWLGTVIVAHKLPAGYAIARRLRAQGGALACVALPACAVGVVAVPAALLTTGLPPSAPVGALCQGLAAGIFLHVGLECVSSEGPGGGSALRTPGWRFWLPVGLGMGLMLGVRVMAG